MDARRDALAAAARSCSRSSGCGPTRTGSLRPSAARRRARCDERRPRRAQLSRRRPPRRRRRARAAPWRRSARGGRARSHRRAASSTTWVTLQAMPAVEMAATLRLRLASAVSVARPRDPLARRAARGTTPSCSPASARPRCSSSAAPGGSATTRASRSPRRTSRSPSTCSSGWSRPADGRRASTAAMGDDGRPEGSTSTGGAG